MTSLPHANLELIRRVLGDDYLNFKIDKLVIEEAGDGEVSLVKLEMSDPQGTHEEIEGRGVGVVDAVWSALQERYAAEYGSLKSIELAKFSIGARLDTKKAKAGVDAVGEIVLEVRNSEGQLFTFRDESRSIVSSSARTVLAAIEYFINAERAFLMLYRSRKDAQERNRVDLITRYTREMAEVVKSTSYAEVIENIKEDLKKDL